jgi:hypothetical protein
MSGNRKIKILLPLISDLRSESYYSEILINHYEKIYFFN